MYVFFCSKQNRVPVLGVSIITCTLLKLENERFEKKKVLHGVDYSLIWQFNYTILCIYNVTSKTVHATVPIVDLLNILHLSYI